MIPHFGIDTSILVRLLSGDPPAGHDYCVEALAEIVNQGGEVYASNQVIGEAYIVMQRSYGASKSEAREGLVTVLRSGYVRPLNGQRVITEIQTGGGAGVVDRLITDGYSKVGCETLTLDRKMANLPDTRIL